MGETSAETGWAISEEVGGDSLGYRSLHNALDERESEWGDFPGKQVDFLPTSRR